MLLFINLICEVWHFIISWRTSFACTLALKWHTHTHQFMSPFANWIIHIWSKWKIGIRSVGFSSFIWFLIHATWHRLRRHILPTHAFGCEFRIIIWFCLLICNERPYLPRTPSFTCASQRFNRFLFIKNPARITGPWSGQRRCPETDSIFNLQRT